MMKNESHIANMQSKGLFPFESPVWDWFSLSYASYLVLPRAALCAMGTEWQQRMVDLMEEMYETIDFASEDYQVTVRGKDGRFTIDPLGDYKYYDRMLITEYKARTF